MKYLKKLLVGMLTLALLFSIFSTVKVKADSSFSLEDLSADEIVDLIFDSCSGIYPKEGQTTEEWATYLNKKIPFLNSQLIDNFKKTSWTNSSSVELGCYEYYYYSSYIDRVTNFEIRYGKYAEAMDGSFHLSDMDNHAKYIRVSLVLSNNYKKASNLYDKLVKKLDKYYNTGTNNKNTESNNWRYTIKGCYDDHAEVNQRFDYGDSNPTVLSLSKSNSGYEFVIVFIHPNCLNNPTELAKSMLKSSGSTSDEDEFVFDETIELDDPSIKSLTNKKGKKIVIKFAGDSSFDNETFKIQVSTSKKFKSIKEFETSKSSATISNLKKGKTYYVRVMYTVTEDGENVSSNWSKTKSITIKK